GVVTLNNSASMGTAGVLALTNTRLILGGFDLTLNNPATTAFSGTFAATNMVVADGAGQLKKAFASGATAIVTFPVGDLTASADYSPAALTFSANSTARIIGVRITDAQHPQDNNTND